MVSFWLWGADSPNWFMLWVASCVGCVLVASTRRHPVLPFLLVGVALGLPGLMLTVVATAFGTPPTTKLLRQLRLAAVWARDPHLGDQIDEDLLLKMGTAAPELVPVYEQAERCGQRRRFVGHLEEYLRTAQTAMADLPLYLATAVFLYMCTDVAAANALRGATPYWHGFFRSLHESGVGIWTDVGLPTLFYLGLRSGRLRLGFGRLLALQHERHVTALASMTLAAGIPPEDVSGFIQNSELAFDTTSLAWLRDCASGEEAEKAAFEEAERLATRVQAQVVRLWSRQVALYALLAVVCWHIGSSRLDCVICS